MKRVIRNCVFESNSSLSHSLIIMGKDQYEKWDNDGLYYFNPSEYYNPFEKLPQDQQPKKGNCYTRDEALNFLKLCSCTFREEDYDAIDQFLEEEGDFVSSDRFYNNEYLETSTYNYTTPNGEDIVIVARYGMDG